MQMQMQTDTDAYAPGLQTQTEVCMTPAYPARKRKARCAQHPRTRLANPKQGVHNTRLPGSQTQSKVCTTSTYRARKPKARCAQHPRTGLANPMQGVHNTHCKPEDFPKHSQLSKPQAHSHTRLANGKTASDVPITMSRSHCVMSSWHRS
eukprot:229099-Chlamydomonas_euryale.AAC.12